jgi:amino-acid N-acetyltransferase
MKVSDLRGILQYVPRFRDRIFVVALDGEIVSSPNFANILLDLAVLRSLSIKVIIVHGASAQIAQLAAERGVAISNADGTGVTDDLTLKVGLEAATNVTNEIMQGLTSVDLRAVYANAIIAHPAGILGGVDHLAHGRVERVDTKALHLFLNEGITPVIPPIGFDGEGRTFRVNSDSIALEVAEAVQAMKIIYLSARDGVVVNGEIVKQLSIIEAEEIVKKRRPATRGRHVFETRSRRARLPARDPARPFAQRPARRSAPQRGFQSRRHRHDDLLERVPANPPHFQKRTCAQSCR